MPTRKNKDIARIVNRVNKSSADFVNRLKDPNRVTIPDWEDSRYIATHKLGVGTDNNGQVFIFPSVQNINGKLVDFTNPKFGKWDGMDSAIERNDTVHVDNIQDGLDFTENYKRYYPKGKTFKLGGRRKAKLGLEDGVPTQEEYITQQIAAKRAAALDKSRNRTSVRVPMIENTKSKEDWENSILNRYKAIQEDLNLYLSDPKHIYSNTIKSRKEILKSLEDEYRLGYPKLVPGANCMYNAGDCYGLDITSNVEFATKAKQLGFKKGEKGSMEPGDIVQDVKFQRPVHAMIYDSKDKEGNLLFNYARGYDDNDAFDIDMNYVRQGKYPLPIKDFDVYKYVGTPADSTQWINEYKEMYGNGMRCGGRRKAQLGLDIREGGIAIPIAPNMYYMDGRSHDNGGIAIGPNNKNGLEVEGGEVVKVGNNDIKVFSSVPLLRGVSPAQLVLGGANPNKVFKAQEEFKDRNRINDDGTTYEIGGEKRIYELSDIQKNQYARTGKLNITGYPITPLTKGYNTLRALGRFRTTFKKSLSTGEAINNTVKGWINDVTKNTKQNPSKTASLIKSVYNSFIGKRQENLGLLHENTEDRVIKKKFGGQDDTKTAALKRLKAKHTIKGVYGGGESGGAGAGSVIMEIPEYVTDTITKRYLVPVTQNFNDAFGDAVNAGLDKFIFNDKWYNTKKGNNPNNNAVGATRTQTVYLPVEHKEVRRRKKEFGGSMIYTINGNIKNGLSLRPKAKMGKEEKIDDKTKIGEDGLVYKRGADGNWYTDGTVHASRRKITSNKNIKQHSSKPSTPTTLEKVSFTSPLIQGERKKIGNLYYEQTEDGQWKPAANQSSVTTRNSGKPVDFGMTRVGVNHPNGKYIYHPLTGEKINTDGTIETEEPSVKSVTKVSSKKSTSSTPRRGESKSAETSRGTAKVESPKPVTATNPNEARYASRVQKGQAQEVTPKPVVEYNETTDKNPDKYRYTRAAGFKAGKSTPSTGGETQSKDGRWVGQYKTTNVGDWIGLGSNLVGSVASYFMTKSAIDKMPEPLKPIMAQAAKLKTRYNIEPQLTNVRETEQMNRASVRRNTQSSNTSLAREQRLMNEARGAKNILYGQKENIETQLINQDRLNRQSVMRDNVKAYNEYLNKLTTTKVAQNQLKISNINNLISGLTGSVNNILGNIESRRATNNTLRAIAAANPNVDARLIGGFDYYIDPITKKKYNKNQQYVGTING